MCTKDIQDGFDMVVSYKYLKNKEKINLVE